jgi:single-stranded-DNA-specific exonuclease
MSLDVNRIDAFRERFNEEVGKRMSAELMIPGIRIDSPLDPSAIDGRFWAVLQQFEPFGPANSRPVFLGRRLQVVGRPQTMGKSQNHIRFSIRSSETKQSRVYKVIGFDMAGQMNLLKNAHSEGDTIDLLFSVEENDWKGTKTIELRARDIRVSSVQGDPVVAAPVEQLVLGTDIGP